MAPWRRYIPVLIEGEATYYIKPLYELLSETPGQETAAPISGSATTPVSGTMYAGAAATTP